MTPLPNPSRQAPAEATHTATAIEGNPLNRLAERLAEDMTAVNATIIGKMHSDVPLIPELASHLIAAGGKRIRPLLTLACTALFGYQGTRQHKLAACVEFIHTATLLHDDVVDESSQRRGKASANAIFGNEAAVLVGDFLFSRSFQLMTEDGSLEVLKILSDASAVIAEGEVMQLTTANNIETSTEQYLQVIGAKTAALFAAACEVGGVIAGRPAQDCKALRDYGEYLGVAFQISDDVLDYGADAARLGKSLGDDFKEGKMTLPVIIAIEKGDESERAFWARVMGTPEQQQPQDLATAMELLQKHDALVLALREAEAYAAKGVACLKTLPEGPIRQDLGDLIHYAVRRDH